MKTKEILKRLDEILVDFEEDYLPKHKNLSVRDCYFSKITSLLDNEYLCIPAELVRQNLSPNALLLFGLFSHIFFTDGRTRYGWAVFDPQVAADFLSLSKVQLEKAKDELLGHTEGKTKEITFAEEDGLWFFSQRL